MKHFCFFIIVILLCVTCKAEESVVMEQYDATGIAEIYEIKNEVFPEFDSRKIAEDLSKGKGFDTPSILRKILQYFMGEFKNNFRILALLIGVGFIVGIIHNLNTSFGTGGAAVCGETVGYVVFAGILSAAFIGLMEPAKEMLDTLSVLVAATIPVLLSILTMSGGVISSGLLGEALIGLVNIITPLINRFLLPLIYSAFALSVASNMTDKIKISHTISSLNKAVKWLLLFFMAVYAGVFGIYGLSGSAIDATAGKAIRFAIGSGIPLVGGVASDSLETVLATLSATRNLIGTTGMCVVVATALTPVIKTAVLMWMFRLCLSIIEPFSGPHLIKLLSDTSECITSVFAVLISVILMFIGAIGVLLITGNFVVR